MRRPASILEVKPVTEEDTVGVAVVKMLEIVLAISSTTRSGKMIDTTVPPECYETPKYPDIEQDWCDTCKRSWEGEVFTAFDSNNRQISLCRCGECWSLECKEW